LSALDKKNKKVGFIASNLFLCIFATYLLTASGPNFYNTDAAELRLHVVTSIVESADLTVSKKIGIRGADGRYYSWFGIGSVLLSVPFSFTGKIIGVPMKNAVSVVNQIIGAGTVIVIFYFLISLGYTRRTSLIVALIYGLGTIAWPLAKQPFNHTIEIFFILFSVYCMYLYVTCGKISNLLFSALSLGFAVITRSYSIIMVPSLFIMMVIYNSKNSGIKTTAKITARDIVTFFIAILPFVSLFFWYNYYRFGNVFETGYTLIAARTGVDYFSNTPLLTGLSGLFISPGKGFFYYTPVAILFFFSVKAFVKKHPRLGVSIIIIMISYVLFISNFIYWHGDWAWGPRYISVLTPFFIIPIAELIDSDIWNKKKVSRAIIYFIISLSLVVQIAAVSVDFQKYFIVLLADEEVEFVEAYSDGLQCILEPPPETYFNWRRSPILAQFGFVYNIARNIKDYRYAEPPVNADNIEKIQARICMNVFDFWWLYEYFGDRNYSGLFVAFILFVLSVYTAVKLWRAVM
jgi:hypothetical protein